MPDQYDANGGPAFPSSVFHDEGVAEDSWVETKGGMSLRDYFAGQALIGITVSLHSGIRPVDLSAMAGDCYLIADALIAARTKDR